MHIAARKAFNGFVTHTASLGDTITYTFPLPSGRPPLTSVSPCSSQPILFASAKAAASWLPCSPAA